MHSTPLLPPPTHTYINRTLANIVTKSTECKNSYCFMRLPNHDFIQACPDAMHTVKNCIERIFFLHIGKAKMDKVLLSESALGSFNLKVPSRKRKQGEKTPKTKIEHQYVLSSSELTHADARSKITMTSNDFMPANFFFQNYRLKIT